MFKCQNVLDRLNREEEKGNYVQRQLELFEEFYQTSCILNESKRDKNIMNTLEKKEDKIVNNLQWKRIY